MAVITVTIRHTLDLKQILHFSAGQCMALEVVNFLPITSPDDD